ncbi:plastocyanin/azurin family copper-binding protein [Halopenitus salinus]|uniref:Plastocyanin/azurin family copper-binding protein n=1 Tax=Halopenitus salinus TaxID=1198295 RepID=A0ABD5UUN8_9EURY
MKRREFMRTAGGSAAAATAATAATGSAAAQEDGGGGGAEVRPVWPSAVESGNLGTYLDARGQDEVTISVGAGDGLAFGPTKVWVDPGTTVIWEWTGNGGDHNVHAVEGPASFESQITGEGGFTFEYETSEEDAGITHYQCDPHAQVGMHAGLAVGEDIETEEVGGANTGWPESVHDIGVPLHAHWVGLVSGVAITLTLAFTFYVLKYGESAHSGHGGGR